MFQGHRRMLEVFEVAVSCKVKPKVYARFEDNSMMDDGK